MNAKQDIAGWMNQVLEENNWTPAEWARRADTSSTNITRFLTDQKFMPSGTTIEKLSGVVQIPPPLGNQKIDKLQGRYVPMASVETSGKVINLNREEDHVITMVPVGTDAMAIEVTTDRFSLGGILPGDILIFETYAVREPEQGNLIVFYNNLEVEVGRLEEPFIMPHSSNADHSPVLFKDAEVLGVGIEQIRRLL